VVLANFDVVDKLGVAVRIPFGHLLSALLAALFASFRSRAALQLEMLALRHQLGVLQRSVKRPKLTPADRLLWAWLCAVWNDWQSSVFIVKAATVIGWHRKGFRLFWTWKLRHGKPGRPSVPKEVRQLIRTMSRENPLIVNPERSPKAVCHRGDEQRYRHEGSEINSVKERRGLGIHEEVVYAPCGLFTV
jgi:hypothetical protein